MLLRFLPLIALFPAACAAAEPSSTACCGQNPIVPACVSVASPQCQCSPPCRSYGNYSNFQQQFYAEFYARNPWYPEAKKKEFAEKAMQMYGYSDPNPDTILTQMQDLRKEVEDNVKDINTIKAKIGIK